jgi:choline-glycine betaine transporter
LTALQAAAISAALPFSVIMIFMTAGFLKALYEDMPAISK